MAFMVKDGFRLYYEDTGGNAPTVLFLHGAGGNHLSWWQQVPVFAVDPRNSDHVRWMIGTVIAMANQSHQSEELILEKS